MTLYNHFKSKDELILAALQRRDERFRAEFRRDVEAASDNPRERLLVIFDVLDEWFHSPDFNGCLFINASAEFGDESDPIHAEAAEHKRLFIAYLRDLAEAAAVPEPQRLAERLALLVEGAIVTAHVCGDRDAAQKAKPAARILLHEAAGPCQRDL